MLIQAIVSPNETSYTYKLTRANDGKLYWVPYAEYPSEGALCVPKLKNRQYCYIKVTMHGRAVPLSAKRFFQRDLQQLN